MDAMNSFDDTRLASVPRNLETVDQQKAHQSSPLHEISEVAYDSVERAAHTSPKQVCLHHGKQIEAFCTFDR